MPIIRYRIDIISALKNAGYSTYRIRKEKLLSESTLQKFRNGELVSWENLSTVCAMLNCQPGDILDFIPDSVEKRISELTKLRKEELEEYFSDQWASDNSEEIKLAEQFHDEIIDGISEANENHVDSEITNALLSIVESYSISDMSGDSLNTKQTWEKIENKYNNYIYQIHAFFDPYVEEFQSLIDNAKNEYIQNNIESELKNDALNIQAKALNEYLGATNA